MYNSKKKFINKFSKAITNPSLILLFLLGKIAKAIPDKQYLQFKFWLKMGKRLNLKNPVTYNEKLQWLKLNYQNPAHTEMVDKASVKQFVAETIGSEYVIPMFGCWDKFDDIDFSKLPNQFVLKTTHGCGGIIICKNKSELNILETKEKLEKSLKQNYFIFGREWPYKNVIPKIIAEEYMVDESGTELKDYKFFCFNGQPKVLFVATDRATDTRFDFYDMNFNSLPIINGHERAVKKIAKPKNFERMIELSKKLSKHIPHVRVDFYNVNGKIFFGEMTFYHWGGMKPFEPEEWDYTFGNWLELPERMV